jgi:DNA primase
VIVCTDSDPAGTSWTERLTTAGCPSVQVANLPDGHDPASWLHVRGPAGLLDIASPARALDSPTVSRTPTSRTGIFTC